MKVPTVVNLNFTSPEESLTAKLATSTQLRALDGFEGDETAVALIVKIAKGLHAYGISTHRLERAVNRLIECLGLEGQFFALPTSIFFSFGEAHRSRTILMRVEPGEVNVGKLADLYELTNRIADGEVSAEDGLERVDEIRDAAPNYGKGLICLAYGVVSATSCSFLGGGWREIVVAGTIGIIVGLFGILCGLSERAGRIFVPVGAALASALAVVAANRIVPTTLYITTLAGLIVLLPGLTLTTAMSELANRQLMAGTARLISALLLFFVIVFGVAFGAQIDRVLPNVIGVARPVPLGWWSPWAALMVAPFAFAVLFNARKRDIGWVMLGCVVSFIGSRLGAAWLGWEFSPFLGAMCGCAMGNLIARWTPLPATVVISPAIMMLVPGSVGYGSVLKLLQNDVVSGVETGVRMAFVAVSIVTGLLMANVLVPTRKSV